MRASCALLVAAAIHAQWHCAAALDMQPVAAGDDDRQRLLQTNNSNCKDNESLCVFDLRTDRYPWETSWKIFDSSGVKLASGPPGISNYERETSYVGALCLTPGRYRLRMIDDSGDGICCEYGQGSFKVSVKDETALQSDDANYNRKDYFFRVAPRSAPSPPPVKKYDACIIGAGWAGLRAAKTLLDAGIKSILVLEANDYVGGRSKTVNADGSVNVPNPSDVSYAPLDMGSEWLYVDGNDLEDYLRDRDYLENIDLSDGRAYYVPASYDADGKSAYYRQFKRPNGNVVTRRVNVAQVKQLHDGVWDTFLAFRDRELRSGPDQSYLSAAKKFIERMNLTKEKDPEAMQYLNLFLALAEVDYVADTSELSLGEVEYGDGNFDRCHYMSVPGVGYGNTAATFAETTGVMKMIQLGAKVTEINRKDQNNIDVSFTKNGVASGISAKTVLVTASLGVLKAGSISFNPALPSYKREAIANQGFGVFNKCAMQWNDNDSIVWPDEEWFELMTPDQASSQKWTTFHNPTARKGIATLVGFIGGDDAKAMELQTDEEVLSDVMKNLKAMFPTIRRPDRVVISRWGQEENMLGTYSFKAVGEDFYYNSRQLKRRVNNNIFFAGEHTAGSWYGTTVGAWNSGDEAAEDMIDELKR